MSSNLPRIVFGQGAFALVNLNQPGGLVVRSSRENLRLVVGNGGTTGDRLGEDVAGRLNTNGERADINSCPPCRSTL